MNKATTPTPLWTKCINWLLYSHVFIAFCAVAMTLQTAYLLPDIQTSPILLGLVFFSTLTTYALHRLVSAHKLGEALSIERFSIIKTYQHHIWGYTIIGAMGAAVCFLCLPWRLKAALLVPGLLSLGYVLPFWGKQRLRLRDVHYLKIFLIAGVWAYVTVVLPAIEQSLAWERILPIALERALFIFMITLPFDLRDVHLDAHHAVKTLPTQMGTPSTLYLATAVGILWIILVGCLYTVPSIGALWASGIYAWGLVCYAPNVNHDYYYTGLIDGTMLVQFGVVALVL